MTQERPQPAVADAGREALEEDGSGPERRRSIFASPFFWAAIAGLVLIPAMRPLLRFEPPPPPVLYELPAYQLVDRSAEGFGSEDLRGHVYVAAFFFTRCGSVCPLLMTAMQRLGRRFDEAGVDVQLVGISVDPEHDTPEVLREYARAHGIGGDRWHLLTGDEAAVRHLVVAGFRTAMGDSVDVGPGLVDIAHSGLVALVDGAGGVRGYYDTSEEGLDEVFHRSQHVLHEHRPPPAPTERGSG